MLCGDCDGLAKTPAKGLLVGTISDLDRSRRGGETTSVGVNLVRSQVSYRAAQGDRSRCVACREMCWWRAMWQMLPPSCRSTA